MGLESGYKQTDIGVIPDNWDAVPLGQLGESLIGLTYRPQDVRDHGILVLRASNIQNNSLRFDDNVFVEMQIPERIMVRPNDVLICVRNGSRDLIGKSALLDDRTVGMTFGAFMAVFRCPSGHFISYLFQSHILKRQIDQHLGATINQITNKSLNAFLVPLPREDHERNEIATVLSDIDALLEGLEKLIAKKRDLKHAAMQQLLTGQTRLPGFTGNWEVNTLGEIANVKTGPFGSSLHESDYVESGTPIITVEHLGEFRVEHFNLPRVSDFDWNRLRAYELKVGDLVFSRVGSVDRNALIRKSEEGWLFSGRLLRVRPDNQKAYAPFLSYQFHAETFLKSVREVAVGQTMACLNTQILKGVPVSLPPLPEQTAIAAVLTDMDAEIEALEQRLAKTRDLKLAMMQELLTGKTRLVDPEMAHA